MEIALYNDTQDSAPARSFSVRSLPQDAPDAEPIRRRRDGDTPTLLLKYHEMEHTEAQRLIDLQQHTNLYWRQKDQRHFILDRGDLLPTTNEQFELDSIDEHDRLLAISVAANADTARAMAKCEAAGITISPHWNWAPLDYGDLLQSATPTPPDEGHSPSGYAQSGVQDWLTRLSASPDTTEEAIGGENISINEPSGFSPAHAERPVCADQRCSSGTEFIASK
ncbi:hypothetical protein LTR17_013118 [Elasticomyces elasticus]|nr:hypothetical protein LTR17_013118 [Elasticomyces elasticus]